MEVEEQRWRSREDSVQSDVAARGVRTVDPSDEKAKRWSFEAAVQSDIDGKRCQYCRCLSKTRCDDPKHTLHPSPARGRLTQPQ